MPPQIPQTLIEVVKLDDIRRLRAITLESRAFEVLFEIIHRLPRPRVYIAQPIGPVGTTYEGFLWGMGADTLTAELSEHNRYSITPDTLRWIFQLGNKSLLLDQTKRRNPFIIELMTSNYLDEIYLAKEEDNPQSGLRTKIEDIAMDKNIPIYSWKAEVVEVFRP
jgi:hypothetical protein